MANGRRVEIKRRCFKVFRLMHVNPLLTHRRHAGWCIKMDTMNVEGVPERETSHGMV